MKRLLAATVTRAVAFVFATVITSCSMARAATAWPLRASVNGRYLVDAHGAPFLVNGDSVQSLMANLSEADTEAYFANREAKGVNAVWVHVWATRGLSVQGDPFTTKDDVAAPREEYFAHVDRVLNLAKSHGILIFLGVSGDNSQTRANFTDNGAAKLREFGRYLGRRYKNQGNIVWAFGNDWKTYTDPTINGIVLQQAAGIKETDTGRHLMTLEIYPTPKLSSDADSWAEYVGINAAYSYAPIYETVKRGYNRVPAVPVVMFEAVYETRGDAFSRRHGYAGTDRILRSNEHWSILSGALGGHLYGNEATYVIEPGGVPNFESPAQNQLIHIRNFYGSRRWFDLVPDFTHTIVTAGFGECPRGAEWKYDLETTTCTTTAATADGTLMIAYMERARPLTVDMSRLARDLSAKWFNPETGVYTAAGGPFPNTGSRTFTPPAGGAGDWVLVLEFPRPNR